MPLLSCVMATRRRLRFLPLALRCFLRRTYANAELLVVDDGDRPAGALCRDLPGVRYLRLTQPTPTGVKLNLGIEAARGRIIQKLDDDDFYAPHFLATSVAHLPRRDLRTTVVTRCCFLILLRDSPVLRHSGHGWKPGGALCFHRALWERRPFRELEKSEDSVFLRDHDPRVVRICDAERQYIVVRHGRNTWKAIRTEGVTQLVDDYFHRLPAYDQPLSRVVRRSDFRFYRSLFRWS